MVAPEDYISRVLAVPIAIEGDMGKDEALAILSLTDKRGKWLLSRVHPDHHRDRQEQATAATARVNQAMHVRAHGVNSVATECASEDDASRDVVAPT